MSWDFPACSSVALTHDTTTSTSVNFEPSKYVVLLVELTSISIILSAFGKAREPLSWTEFPNLARSISRMTGVALTIAAGYTVSEERTHLLALCFYIAILESRFASISDLPGSAGPYPKSMPRVIWAGGFALISSIRVGKIRFCDTVWLKVKSIVWRLRIYANLANRLAEFNKTLIDRDLLLQRLDAREKQHKLLLYEITLLCSVASNGWRVVAIVENYKKENKIKSKTLEKRKWFRSWKYDWHESLRVIIASHNVSNMVVSHLVFNLFPNCFNTAI